MLRALVTAYVESRRKVRRADFAVAFLRRDAAMMRRPGRREDHGTAAYLDALADLIEKTP